MSPEFAARRDKLRKSIPNGVLVLFGNKESDDLHYSFFQETNFLYLTGWEEPGAILILTPEPEKDAPGLVERARAPREILFVPQRVASLEKWTGRKLGPDDSNVSNITGFATVMPAERFESQLRALLDIYPNVYALAGDPSAAALEKIAPLRTVIDARPLIATLRMEKSASEISAISRRLRQPRWKLIGPPGICCGRESTSTRSPP